jgi:hypothetical protein
MMKWTVPFCVVLFCAVSFAAGADNKNNKKSNKNNAKSSSTSADHNVLHALQKFFTGKDASHQSPTPVHHRKSMRRDAEEATSSPESKASPEAIPSPTTRRVVLPESSPVAKPTVSPTPASSAESDASPASIVVPVPSAAKGDLTPKGD